MNQTLSMDQVFLNKVTDIIEANLENEKFGAEELSHELGMSRSNINRRLKSLQKNSISQLIQTIRLQRAMEMLQQKVATASEVAFRVGFSSPTYFNKCFHEYYGFPPGEVKKLEEYNREKAKQILTSEPVTANPIPTPKNKKLTNRKKLILWIIFSALIVMLLLFSLFFFFRSEIFRHSSTANNFMIKDAEKSIAVLPFKNLSNDPEQDWFSEGMMEEILSHLFMIGGLRIPSSSSTMRFKGTKLSLKEIARELGVSYLLVGNVSRAGDNVRIIVRLVNGRNEQLLWTEDYNRAFTAADLHEIQSDVAQQVAENLKVVINPEVKKRMEARPTENTEAYLLYLQAWQVDIGMKNAYKLLERAVLLDPDFADAYATMAGWRMWTREDSLSREQMLEKVEPLLNKALQLDKNSTLAHALNAEFRFWFYWDFESVETEFEIFRQISPSNTEGYSNFVQYLWAVGRFREAYGLCEDDFENNKSSPYPWIMMALAYYYVGEIEKSCETIETALRIFQKHSLAQFDQYGVLRNALHIFVWTERYKEAIAIFEKDTTVKELNDLEDDLLGPVGIAYFKTGNNSKATTVLNELLSRNSNFFKNESSEYAAAIYVAMGENEKALQNLEKAYTKRELGLASLKNDPYFRSLHGDPRFEDLLRRIGFK
jgi:TolB-like protein/AraC-like DNA-binding protein/Tfp pilus assembly protein PilF